MQTVRKYYNNAIFDRKKQQHHVHDSFTFKTSRLHIGYLLPANKSVIAPCLNTGELKFNQF